MGPPWAPQRIQEPKLDIPSPDRRGDVVSGVFSFNKLHFSDFEVKKDRTKVEIEVVGLPRLDAHRNSVQNPGLDIKNGVLATQFMPIWDQIGFRAQLAQCGGWAGGGRAASRRVWTH